MYIYSQIPTNNSLVQELTYILVTLLTVGLTSCQPINRDIDASYSFFVAGHVYGHPQDPAPGLHPPFVDYLSTLNSDSTVAFGFFAGDMVYRSTEHYWSVLDTQLQLFRMPIYLVAGNHDRGPLLDKRLPEATYTFTRNDDTFVVLDAGKNWTLDDDQLDLLSNTIAEAPKDGHIFVIMHELLWWTPDGPHGDIRINYADHYPGKTNFDTAVMPMLSAAQRPITLIAGDLGATAGVSSLAVDTVGQVTLLATGMGDGKRDHVLKVEVDRDSLSIYAEYLQGTKEQLAIAKIER